MNKELSKYSSYKLYIWKLLHSLINYFFNIYVKKRYNINDNCYLYFKKIGYQNQVLVNYITFGETIYFKSLNMKLVKFIINMDTKIPICKINEINIHPKIFNIHTIADLFSVWANHLSNTLKTVAIFNNLYDELCKFAILEIKYTIVHFECFRIKISNIKVFKNKNKTRLFANKLDIYYNDSYICSVNKIKLSHDAHNGNINIFATKMLIIIKNYILKFNIVNDINNILNKFEFNKEGLSPNIYVDKISVQFLIHNHTIFNLQKFIHENKIIKFDGVIKIWKKEIFWIKQCTYNLSKKTIIANNIRIRLFKSTADKLFKTFRPIYKKYYNKKTPKLKSVFNKITNVEPNHSYFNSLDKDSSNNKPNILSKFAVDYNNNYMKLQVDSDSYDLLQIATLTIDFQDNNGSFIYKDFTYSNIKDGLRVTASKWLFKKNKIIYLDSVDNKSKFIVEYQYNSLSIYPYKLYLNLDLDIFSQTFGMFTTSIGRIVDIFVIHRLHKNYIYDKFYIDSCRIIFSYQTKNLQFFNLIAGKYSELINILELNNMDFILQPISLTYPKDFSFILSNLINKLLEDIVENNFETLIKATPISLSYNISKQISYLSSIADKCYKIILNKNYIK
jgi:hypothetical protein